MPEKQAQDRNRSEGPKLVVLFDFKIIYGIFYSSCLCEETVMDKATFDRILTEEGIYLVEVREYLWRVRPFDQDEAELRLTVQKAIADGFYELAKSRIKNRDAKITKH